MTRWNDNGHSHYDALRQLAISYKFQESNPVSFMTRLEETSTIPFTNALSLLDPP